MPIEAVIFDMDGVLIDSEEIWREAEAAIFQSVGVPMTPDDGRLTMGLRSDEVVEYWFARYPWSGPTKTEINAAINRAVIDLVKQQAGPLPGALEAIDRLHRAGYPLGLASSSIGDLIEVVVDKLGVRDRLRVLQSAEHEPYGKPHPGVYIAAARALGVAPERCLAIEDSPAGLLAAKAAKMACFVAPAPEMRGDRRYCIADRQFASLSELTLEMVTSLP